MHNELDRLYFVVGNLLTKNTRLGLEALTHSLESEWKFESVEEELANMADSGLIDINNDSEVSLL